MERKLNTEQDQSALSPCLLATRINNRRCTGAKNGVKTAQNNGIEDRTVTNDCDSFIKQDSENNRDTGTTGYETNVFDTELLQLYSYDKSVGKHNTEDSVSDKPDKVPVHGNQAEYDSQCSLLRRLDSHTHNPNSKSRFRNETIVNSQEFSDFGGSGSAVTVVKPISLRLAKTPRSFGHSECISVNTSKGFSETGCTNSKYAAQSKTMKTVFDGEEDGRKEQSRKRKWFMINSVSTKDHRESPHTNSKSKTARFTSSHEATKKQCISSQTNKHSKSKSLCDKLSQSCDIHSHSCDKLSQSWDKLSQSCDIRSQSCDRLSQSYDRLSQSSDKLSQSCGNKKLINWQGTLKKENSSSEANDDEQLKRLIKKKRKIKIYTPKESEKPPVVKKDSLVKNDKPKVSKLLEALDY